jgi:hypothetical protein
MSTRTQCRDRRQRGRYKNIETGANRLEELERERREIKRDMVMDNERQRVIGRRDKGKKGRRGRK